MVHPAHVVTATDSLINTQDWSEARRKELLTRGYSTIERILSPEILQRVQNELKPWLEQVSWSDVPGYAIVSGDKWLLHMGLCSKTLLNIVLHEHILNFMAALFGKEPILAEFSLHHSMLPNRELAFHSDRDGGIILYIFLSDMTAENGQLCMIPSTQDRNEYFFIPAEEIEKHRAEIVPLTVRAGDAVLFDQDIWHKRAAGKAGRSVVKVIYQPYTHANGAVDHVFRQSMLEGLTERQLKCLGIGSPAFGREGHFRKLGKRFWKSDVKTFVHYLLNLRHVGHDTTPPRDPYFNDKLHARPPRSRVR